jgi:hypothetical protein
MELKDALKKGPLTGRELYELTGHSIFSLWKASNNDEEVLVQRIDRPYLRFDRRVEGFARISPSLEREFLTYTAIGLARDIQKIEKRMGELDCSIKKISEEKLETSKRAIQDVLERLGDAHDEIEAGACFIIGGDVPLQMAHADPRPEVSTGKMVAGSDLDIVVILKDDFKEELEKALDDAIYDVKYQLLTRPTKGEEIDYVIKRESKVKEQAEFDTFEHMVACKILDEGQFLWGNASLYDRVIAVLAENTLPKKLEELKSTALKQRENIIKELLSMDELSEDAYIKMFTTTEEFGEIF